LSTKPATRHRWFRFALELARRHWQGAPQPGAAMRPTTPWPCGARWACALARCSRL